MATITVSIFHVLNQ